LSLIAPPGEELGVQLPKSGVRVTYKKGLKRITLQRVLTSLIVFHREAVTFDEILVFYDNLIWCLEKSLKDPDFRHKFGKTLEDLSKSVSRVLFSQDISGSIQRLSLALKPFSDFYLPERNTRSTYRHFKGNFHVLPFKSTGIPNKELPLKPYIGVGYRDKGTYRDPAFDGSPSWQEVAISKYRAEHEEQTN